MLRHHKFSIWGSMKFILFYSIPFQWPPADRSGKIHWYVSVLPCCQCPHPLHHWSLCPALPRQVSGSWGRRPRRNLLLLAAWMEPLNWVPPAERGREKEIHLPILHKKHFTDRIHGDPSDCQEHLLAYWCSFRLRPFLLLLLLLSEVDLHSAVVVFGLGFLLLFLLHDLGLGLFLGYWDTLISTVSHRSC